MPIGSRLTHTVDIVRATATGTLDDYGQPVESEAVLASVKAAIQPRTQREMETVSQAGAAVTTHAIYLLPTDLTTADYISHDASACPLSADLPDGRFEIIGIANAAGLGHHLEVDARLIASPQEAEGS